MKFLRSLLALSLSILAAGAAIAAAPAPAYPSRPIHLIVPYPPGGSADALGRILAQRLGTALGQPIVVDNRPGAGTAIGARVVAQSAADGYTLLIGTVSSQAINPALMAKVGYDPIRDFTNVAPLAMIPFALLAHPKLGVNSLQELIDLAKRQPGKLNYSSAGRGTSNHLAGEIFNAATNAQTTHIPYKGSAPALTALLGGDVDFMFDLMLTAVPYVKAGTLRGLAVTDKQRSPLLPNVPAVSELGMSPLVLSAWFGLFAPRDLPPAINQRLAKEVAQILALPEVRDQLLGLGASPMGMSAAQFNDYVVAERDRWVQVIKAAQISPE